MNPEALVLDHGTGRLLAVPAVHFDHVFASIVNRLCFGSAAAPEAIAVELGPAMAGAVGNWLKEFCLGPSQKTVLPVMLGLLRRNRLLRVSLKQKAFELQRRTGMDLSELSPEVLHRELGFTGQELLCLSPTDSIIEAVRCGVELELPVYGIDLEESADYPPRPLVFQDGLRAGREFPAYVHRNAPYAAGYRDESIDLRREIAMAARLKTLLERHQRVLFTGGMAHWESIKQLLKDDSVRPAPCPQASALPPEDQVRRVLVHPVMASRYLDRFPAVAERYELWRGGSADASGGESCPDPADIFADCLKTADQAYFAGEVPPSRAGLRTVDLEGRSRFEAYLDNLCLLNHVSVPTLPLLATAARETMSGDFEAAMIAAFMKFPWASRAAFPDLPVISPNSKQGNGGGGTVLLKDGPRPSQPLYLRSRPGHDNQTPPVNFSFEWDEEDSFGRASEAWGWLHTWRPWDYHNASLCYRAMQEGTHHRRMRLRTTVFNGSILDGIDMNATIRDLARGKGRLHVRERVRCRSEAMPLTQGFPIVWILEPSAPMELDWIVLVIPFETLEKHVKDKERLREVASKFGQNMVSSLGYGRQSVRKKDVEDDLIVRSDTYYGQIIFQVPCYSARQFVRWAELTEYRRNPFTDSCSLSHSGPSGLGGFGLGRHGIRMGEWHWTTTLILIALSFAGDDLVVVAPRSYTVEKVVFEKASTLGARVRQVALERFTAKEIQRMSLCHMVSVNDPGNYPEAAERYIGESQTAYRDLVPQQWMRFGGERRCHGILI